MFRAVSAPAAPILTPMPRPAPAHEVLRAAALAAERGGRVVLASVVARRGSTPSTPGQKLVLLDERTALGTIGGGAVERSVLETMLRALRDPAFAARVETFRLGPSLGMCCGGQVDVLVEPIGGVASVIVIGAGHVGAALAPLLASLGFQVTVCDSREEAADPARMPAPSGALLVLHGDHDDPAVLERAPDPASASFLVMTHDHQLDQAAIEHGLAKGFGFVGGVGSRAKAARTRARLEAKGFAPADVARVRMPMGVDIGARSPAEIAVAVAAELVARRAGAPLPGPAHSGGHASSEGPAPTGGPALSDGAFDAASDAAAPAEPSDG
jgi:xanthine dehydrogenase accessory factor